MFMGVDMSDFREGQVENRDKTGNAQFPRALKGNFYRLSLNGKNTLNFTILTSNTLSDFKIEPENSKNLCS